MLKKAPGEDFFDETSDAPSDQQNLMNMIDSIDRKIQANLETGRKVSGTVARITAEYVFVDIDAKIEASIRASELLDKDGNVTVAVGDKVEAYIISITDEDITLSKTLGGGKTDITQLTECLNSRIPVEGKITGINKGGFNVKIMGHRAFCPISQIALQRVEDPNPYLSKTLSFMITRITEGGRNIVVSRIPILEQEIAGRLDELEKAAGSEKVFSGPITKIVDFGLFVDMGGFEGLVHISEVSWERAENLQESFEIGQVVEFVVLKVERREPIRTTKISLSIKQVSGDPWLSIGDKIHEGDSIDGKITRLVNFGAFVELLPGIEGLIHVSEMSWAGRINHPRDVVSEGQVVRVSILGINIEKRTISCSLKDLEEDPWKSVPDRFPVGSETDGTVVQKSKYGYFVDIARGVTGLLPFSNIAAEKKESIQVQQTLPVHIEGLDLERRRISLSHGIAESRHNEEQTRAFLDAQESPGARHEHASATEFGAALQQALKKKGGQ